MIGTLLEANPFLGRIITGRIESGTLKSNQPIKVLANDGSLVETGRVSKILAFRGLERQPIEEAQAGDIVAIAGLSKGTVADTFCDPSGGGGGDASRCTRSRSIRPPSPCPSS